MQALSGENITIYGDGSQTRSFCYVDDMIDGLIALMDDTTDDFTGPVNLGNPTEITILELAKLIIEMTASKSTIEFKALPQDDPIRRKPDISLAKSVLNWLPMIPLRDGLSKTIDYLKGVIE
jgi:UDP-glucuronate decarboxylase